MVRLFKVEQNMICLSIEDFPTHLRCFTFNFDRLTKNFRVLHTDQAILSGLSVIPLEKLSITPCNVGVLFYVWKICARSYEHF